MGVNFSEVLRWIGGQASFVPRSIGGLISAKRISLTFMTFQQKLILFAQGAALYSLAAFLTIISGLRILPFIRILEVRESPGITTLDVIFGSLGLALFLLFIFGSRYVRSLVRFVFFASIFFGLLLFFNVFAPVISSGLLAVYVMILYFLLHRPIVHNIVMLLSLVGMALALGISAPPFTIFVILLIFSLYDVIAVFGTKHMVKMAKRFFSLGLLPGFIITTDPRLQWTPSRVKPGTKFSFLGNGDVVLPLLFVASLIGVRPAYAIGAGVGNILGFAMLVFILWGKKREPLPALPPIVLGEVAGFLVSYLIMRI